MTKQSNIWLDLIKGGLIGVSNIIPGVSGGTMMVSLGIYDKLIWSITHLFSDFKKSIRFLLPILAGCVISIALLSKVFTYLLTHFAIETTLAFCGLIIGSLPMVTKEVRSAKFKAWYLIPFALFFAFIVLSSFFQESSGQDASIVLNPMGIFMLFLAGIVSAGAMVVPGVSGSMVLMLMGYYKPILALVSTAISALVTFNWPTLLWCIGAALPFALGMIFGIFGIAKVIEWLFNHFNIPCHWAITGLVVASPIALLLSLNWSSLSLISGLIGLVCFFIGCFISYTLEKL